jgi:two-component sensor histidine kinase
MSDIYKQRSNWKIILAIVGALILVITLFYSNYLANNLRETELKNAKLFRESIQFLHENSDKNSDIDIQFNIVQNFLQPVIFRDDTDSLTAYNLDGDITNQKYLQSKVNDFIKSGKKPILGTGYSKEIYVFDSKLLTYIRWYPLLQMFLVGSFIALGYFLFNSSKKAEQNRVWAGMAKETAHQLGTPISAIMGWVSYLKDSYSEDENITEVTNELEKDVDRLNLVADRFSKIGSAPELTNTDIYDTVSAVADYMKRRASKQTTFHIEKKGDLPYFSAINSHLFEWVVENLMRNSLDAMDGKGSISIICYKEDKYNCIDIIDTGKGIPASKFKTVFNPGYSTKQRGWGLGLSLAKRIIEEYHKGKIFVKWSKLDEGTCFCIKLQENI